MVKKIKDAVDILDKEGNYIRTYSKKDNGKDYKKLAEEFTNKVAGRKIVPAEKRE